MCTVISMTPCGVHRQNCGLSVLDCSCCVGTAYRQRTHAIQCHCMSEGSMLSFFYIIMHPPTKCKSAQTHNSSSHVRTTASTTAARAHLRALRDTGSTFHGTPDLGEGLSGAHACTTCKWNAKRKRQLGLVLLYRWMWCVGTGRSWVSHVQWKQTGHQLQTDTQDACRAVQWPTTGI